MKSILENRPALAKEVNKVAEVAGYLWQKGLFVFILIITLSMQAIKSRSEKNG